MNARESKNYVAISRSSSASKSVEIYRGRLFFRVESSLRIETKIIISMWEEI